MILWRGTVFRGRSPEDRDAQRVKDELSWFLRDHPELRFGNYSGGDVADVAWEMTANAAEWSGAPSAPVILVATDNGSVLHVRDHGVGVEQALGHPPIRAFEMGVTSATHKPRGRGRGLPFLCNLTAKGGMLIMETGDASIVCLKGRIASSSKSACFLKGTTVSFYFDPAL